MIHVLIPARAGSKGLKNKNILKLNGKELIYYTIKTALSIKGISRVVVSTDSKKISKISKGFGAEVPFLRPKKFAQDHSRDLDVFKHYINWLKFNNQKIPELVVHFRPTSPFRDLNICNQAINIILKNKKISSLRSLRKSIFTPYKMWKLRSNKLVPLFNKNPKSEAHSIARQNLPQTYDHIGYIDIVRVKKTIYKNSMIGNFVKPFILEQKNLEKYIDIDSRNDWIVAKKLNRK